METTEKKKTSRSVMHNPKHCANPSCGKEFTPKNLRGLYCSPSCNAKASAMRSANKFNALQASPSTPFAGMAGLGGVFAIPPHAQMMITHHEKEAARWEDKYKEEVKDHKETIAELNATKTQANEEKRPGGLEGFAERNPALAEKLLDFGITMADKFGSKMIPSAPGAPAAQVLAGLNGQAGEMVRMFSEWLPKINDQSQEAVWALISALSKEDEEKMNYTIQHILQAWRR